MDGKTKICKNKNGTIYSLNGTTYSLHEWADKFKIEGEDMIDMDGLGKESISGQIMSQMIAKEKQWNEWKLAEVKGDILLDYISFLEDMKNIYISSPVLRYRIVCRYASRSPMYNRYREYLRSQYD